MGDDVARRLVGSSDAGQVAEKSQDGGDRDPAETGMAEGVGQTGSRGRPGRGRGAAVPWGQGGKGTQKPNDMERWPGSAVAHCLVHLVLWGDAGYAADTGLQDANMQVPPRQKARPRL